MRGSGFGAAVHLPVGGIRCQELKLSVVRRLIEPYLYGDEPGGERSCIVNVIRLLGAVHLHAIFSAAVDIRLSLNAPAHPLIEVVAGSRREAVARQRNARRRGSPDGYSVVDIRYVPELTDNRCGSLGEGRAACHGVEPQAVCHRYRSRRAVGIGRRNGEPRRIKPVARSIRELCCRSGNGNRAHRLYAHANGGADRRIIRAVSGYHGRAGSPCRNDARAAHGDYILVARSPENG